MRLSVVLDISHLHARRDIVVPAGIDRVDRAYATALSTAPDLDLLGLRIGLAGTKLYSREAVSDLATNPHGTIDDSLGGAGNAVLASIWAWLRRSPAENLALGMRRVSPAGGVPRFRGARGPVHDLAASQAKVGRGAIYLNATTYGLWVPGYLRWLKARPDVRPVFFIHDLLPIDYPEFFQASRAMIFKRIVDAIFRRAAGLVAASPPVAERIEGEVASRGRGKIPIHVAPLPLSASLSHGADLATQETIPPYFVACGTIEPRKNHLLLLHIWRRLIESQNPAPRLILVGRRGWENEEVVDTLERCPDLLGHVLEVNGLPDCGLRWLLSNACAALVPSFAEGHGLPVAEALAVGTPVVASDSDVFRWTSQECAIFRHPLDGRGWMESIVALSRRDCYFWNDARRSVARYRPPSTADYFERLTAFLGTLGARAP